MPPLDTALPFRESPRHTALTRLAHGAVAIAVVIQLASSLVMIPEEPGKVANSAFEVHQLSGLTAFGVVLLFWLTVLSRKEGTALSELLPWASGDRLSALWADTKAHIACITRFKLPAYDSRAPLATAVHGLGLLLVTAMAASGTLYYFINAGDPDAGGFVGATMFVHLTLANLVWAYLIAHAGVAVLYHFASDMSLRSMWSATGLSNREPSE